MLDERIQLIEYPNLSKINALFHYIFLHDSPYYKNKHDGREMYNAKRCKKVYLDDHYMKGKK